VKQLAKNMYYESATDFSMYHPQNERSNFKKAPKLEKQNLMSVFHVLQKKLVKV
jgi:hypothetical protein